MTISDGDHGGKFTVLIDGKKAWTTALVCLISIELTDGECALGSIPAGLCVSEGAFDLV